MKKLLKVRRKNPLMKSQKKMMMREPQGFKKKLNLSMKIQRKHLQTSLIQVKILAMIT